MTDFIVVGLNPPSPPPPRPEVKSTTQREALSLRRAPSPPPPLRELSSNAQSESLPLRQTPPLPPPPLRELGLSPQNQRRFLMQVLPNTPNASLTLQGFASGPLKALVPDNTFREPVLLYNPFDPRRSDACHKSVRFKK